MSKPNCMHCNRATFVRECPDQNTLDQSAYYCDGCKRAFPVPTLFGKARPVLAVVTTVFTAVLGIDFLTGDGG